MPALLAIDQGTTSSRAVIYDTAPFRARAVAQQEIPQHYPRDGWVEHELEDIWYSVASTVRQAVAKAGVAQRDIAAVGITNQRETVAVWDRTTGRPVGRAIVWQDRRTADFCRERAADQPWLTSKTGLVLDPYFSGTKLKWLLDADLATRAAAHRGDLCFGTIDSFLMWRLTGGTRHVTDATNASRTLLFNIHTMAWDDDLLKYFDVPRAMLPQVRPSAADFGTTKGLDFLPDGVPIRGVAGDQQAALFGQGCFRAGEAKCTYGTGAFALRHTGDRPVSSAGGLLTTVAAMTDATPQYAVEGAVFVAGAAVQWLRDGLRLFASADEVERLARAADPDSAVVFVPGFVGLGAPHWVPAARGTLFGLTRATGVGELARAALEGVAFQVADLVSGLTSSPLGERGMGEGESGLAPKSPPHPQPLSPRGEGSQQQTLRVDGGMARNDWFLQFQADILGVPVVRAAEAESTALGAAFLAGLGCGAFAGEADIRAVLTGGTTFTPALPAETREAKLRTWRRAVKAVIAFAEG